MRYVQLKDPKTGENIYPITAYPDDNVDFTPVTKEEIREICTFDDEGNGGGSIPTATDTVLGCIRIGEGLSIDEGGTVSVVQKEQEETTYVLPVASSTVLGGVKVGDHLTIDSNGVLHAVIPEAQPNRTKTLIWNNENPDEVLGTNSTYWDDPVYKVSFNPADYDQLELVWQSGTYTNERYVSNFIPGFNHYLHHQTHYYDESTGLPHTKHFSRFIMAIEDGVIFGTPSGHIDGKEWYDYGNDINTYLIPVTLYGIKEA